VALLMALVVPHRFRDAIAEKWIETYRGLLDTWGLQSLRAQLDVDRRSTESLQSSSLPNTPLKGKKEETLQRLGALAAPLQIYVRCNNCEQSLSLG
jgi:hypothetical protein